VPYGKAVITFRPTHKFILAGNHKPEITDTSLGMWRRVALTPFDVTIPTARRDPALLEKLKAEGSGILNWMLVGLEQYQRNGLEVPPNISGATASYRDDQDTIGQWIAENCETGGTYSEQKRALYENYQIWAKQNGHMPFAQTRLTRRLNERGFRLAPDKRTVHNIALRGAVGFVG
jgi:putative DNA primase/helicase